MRRGRPLTSFVGRERALREARGLLGDARLVTVTGSGGIGKTRFALELAARVTRAFSNEVHVVELASLDDRADVAAAVASTLSVPDQSNTPALHQIARHLVGTRSLLVIDNCEHVLHSVADMVAELLGEIDGLTVLATSREPLGLPGECIYPLGPLSLPAPGATDRASVDESEAVRLLVDRARGLAPSFAVTDDNRSAVGRLCERLDGMPLAIELAAVRLRSLSVEQVLARIDQRFSLLTGGLRGQPPRHKTLWDMINWSHELCTTQERVLWARLSVFAGSFDLDAVEAVCGYAELSADSVLDLLCRLVAQSILTTEPDGAAMRYHLLVTTREFGAQRLDERGERLVTKRRHRDHYLDTAAQMVADWCGPRQPEMLASMRADHANLLAALEWSTTTPGEAQSAAQLASLLRYYWIGGGQLSQGRRWFERILRLDETPTVQRGDALWVAAWVAFIQGDHDWAARCLSSCREVAEQLGDQCIRAHADHWSSALLLFNGRLEESIDAVERAIEVYAQVRDDAAATIALFQLALTQTYAGDRTGALETCGKVLTLSELRGEKWSRAYALWVAGVCHRHLGSAEQARRSGRSALEYQRAFRDGICIAVTVDLLAWLDVDAGNVESGAVLTGAADAVWRQLGTRIDFMGPHIAGDSATVAERLDEALGVKRCQRLRSKYSDISKYDAILLALDGNLERKPADDPVRLTTREFEIARLIAEGLTNRDIGERLVISVRTVDGHVERMLAKLEVGTSAARRK